MGSSDDLEPLHRLPGRAGLDARTTTGSTHAGGDARSALAPRAVGQTPPAHQSDEALEDRLDSRQAHPRSPRYGPSAGKPVAPIDLPAIALSGGSPTDASLTIASKT